MDDRALTGRRGLDDWLLAGEAAAWLAFASIVVAVAPFARLLRLAAWPLGRRGPIRDPDVGARRVRWAVLAAARRVPWRTVCFQRALAAQVMLRRRGLDARLYFGARSDGSLGPSAHVWVRLGDHAVIGTECTSRYAVLACVPPAGGGQGEG